MKVRFSLVLFIVLELAAANIFAQQEITVTATAANTVASKTTIDLPELANNPDAIIIAQPTGNTNIVHPIGVWYYNNKWNIFNTDHATMQLGSTFKVQIFLTRNESNFLHIITEQNAGSDYTILDHPALNNNPNAKFEIFQNHSPDNRPFALFPYRAEANYSTVSGKWLIQYVGSGTKTFQANTAYNVVIKSAGIGLPIDKPIINTNGKTVVPIQPNSNAGGDLNGNYPNPTVVGLNGKPLSSVQPKLGDVLSWNGTAWVPVSITNNNAPAAGDLGGTYPNPTVQKINGKPVSNATPSVGQVLKWNGTAWQPADDNVASSTASTTAPVNKPTFLKYEQTPSGNVEVNSFNQTAIIPGLDNQFFTLTQSSRVVFHTHIALINTNTTPFASGGVGKVVVQILTNTSNAVVAVDQSFTALFPNETVTSSFTGFAVLPAGTYYTKVSIAKYVNTPFKAFAGRLIIEIFPD